MSQTLLWYNFAICNQLSKCSILNTLSNSDIGNVKDGWCQAAFALGETKMLVCTWALRKKLHDLPLAIWKHTKISMEGNIIIITTEKALSQDSISFLLKLKRFSNTLLSLPHQRSVLQLLSHFCHGVICVAGCTSLYMCIDHVMHLVQLCLWFPHLLEVYHPNVTLLPRILIAFYHN